MEVTYKTIRKNNGKTRHITVPSAKDKRKLRQALLSAYTLNTSYGTCSEKDIKQFVLAHKQAKYIIKVDIQDFFDSITLSKFRNHTSIRSFPNGYKIENCFHKHPEMSYAALPQGFPTSPYLSNVFMYAFDSEMQQVAKSNGSIYTRYFDDIVVSSSTPLDQSQVESVLNTIRLKLNRLGLQLNDSKTIHYEVEDFYAILGVTYSKETDRCTTKASHKSYILKHIKWHTHNFDNTPEALPEHAERLFKAMGHLAWIEYIEVDSTALAKCKKQLQNYRSKCSQLQSEINNRSHSEVYSKGLNAIDDDDYTCFDDLPF